MLRPLKRLARTADSSVARIERLVRRPAVLFDVQNGLGLDAQAPVIRHLVQRGRVRVDVSSGTSDATTLADRLTVRDIDATLHVPPRQAARRRYALGIITDSPSIRNWLRPPLAYLHHGSSFANLPNLYALSFLADGTAKYLFCLAEAEARYCEQQLGSTIRDRLVVTGQPKLDAVNNSADGGAALLNQLGLDPARKTVLLISHWLPESLFCSCNLDGLRDHLASRAINVVVTAHAHLFDASRVTRPDGSDWHQHLAATFAAPNMRVVPNVLDHRSLFSAIDLMVGDHSSAYLEYAPLRRPMILYQHHNFEFSDSTMGNLLRGSADLVHSVEQIPALVDRALAAETFDHVARKALLDYSLAYLGRSGERVADVIESLALRGTVPN